MILKTSLASRLVATIFNAAQSWCFQAERQEIKGKQSSLVDTLLPIGITSPSSVAC